MIVVSIVRALFAAMVWIETVVLETRAAAMILCCVARSLTGDTSIFAMFFIAAPQRS
jgi:hypothetical protein